MLEKKKKKKKKKKIHPEKNSFHLRKLNFLTIRLKKFLYFLKRQRFLYFRKGTLHFLSSGLKKESTLQKFLICSQKKAFLIFRELELYYISRKGNPEKNLYISGNGIFLYFLKKCFSYIAGKVYSENPGIFRTRSIFRTPVYSEP